MIGDEAAQRRVATIALAALAPGQFALAGSSAIREHGIARRRTADVDLFTSEIDADRFRESIDDLVAQLRGADFMVEERLRSERFARLSVVDPGGNVVEVDLGIDWREREPVLLDIGPVLDLVDAVGNKVSALYSRAEARDYLDVDAIRRSGRISDSELLASAAERDPGFEPWMFRAQLEQVQRILPERVREYGVDAQQLADVRARLLAWAATLPSAPDH